MEIYKKKKKTKIAVIALNINGVEFKYRSYLQSLVIIIVFFF